MIPVKINSSGELTVARCNCAATMLTPANPTATDLPQAAPASPERETGSYGQILKSSAVVGGSSVMKIAIGIIRTKAMALLLGPAGFGLFGLFGSIADLTQSIAGMGVNSSGVRQIAEAVGSGNKQRIAMTAAVLRRTSILLGLFGAALLLIFSRQVARLTFGGSERAGAVSVLSLAVLFGLVSNGQVALIQGTRRIGDLAKMSVLGAFFSLCISIPLVYFFRQKGVVPSLVGAAGVTVLTSWWFSRRIDIRLSSITFPQFRREGSSLLKLGCAFMASALMVMGIGYFTRITVLRTVGFEATGLYQSAWTLGGLYVSFILQAMGADFYPRLTASAQDNTACNRLVNEQTVIGLLLAGPGVIATLTFAPVVIALFYSAKFGAAVGVLRWICLGVTLQVITWPMGFIIIAKGKSALFFGAELAWTIAAGGLIWLCVHSSGLSGAGIAYFGSYVFHALIIYPIVRRLSDFRVSPTNLRRIIVFCFSIGLVFCIASMCTSIVSLILGTIVLLLNTVYSIRTLSVLVPIDHMPRQVRPLIKVFQFAL